MEPSAITAAEPRPQTPPKGAAALWAAALGGLLASACCVAPLLLLMLGVSGAWLGHLTALHPLQPLFVGAAAVALFLAGIRIWWPQPACAPGQVCAVPRVRWGYRLAFVVVALLVLLGALFPFIAHWFH
jgi:mercuric ion transport protein